MEVAPGFQMRSVQTMLPTPALIAYAGVLAMDGSEVEQAVTHELVENPALVPDDLDAWETRTHRTAAPHASALPATDRAARPAWAEVLLQELRLELPADDTEIATLVVGSLDSRGFLVEDEAELARLGGVSAERIAHVVQALREVGPAGVGARDARHCLLLQLDRLAAEGREHPVARVLIADHLQLLARGKVTAIANAMGVDEGEVLAARAFIRTHLRPRPSLGQDAHSSDMGAIDSVRPDVAISARADPPGSFDVRILEADRIRLHVDPELRNAARNDEDAGLTELIRRADWFLARLRERWTTLRRITTLVAERERDFLSGGAAEYRPLTRATVAASLGIHESTVSRATAGKYVQLPSMQVIPFSVFFDGSLGVRTALRVIISAEPRPLSDAELCDALGRAGHHVARRTVAKYRDRLGILPSTSR